MLWDLLPQDRLWQESMPPAVYQSSSFFLLTEVSVLWFSEGAKYFRCEERQVVPGKLSCLTVSRHQVFMESICFTGAYRVRMEDLICLSSVCLVLGSMLEQC